MHTRTAVRDDTTLRAQLVTFTSHKWTSRRLKIMTEKAIVIHSEAGLVTLLCEATARPANGVASWKLLATCHVPVLRSAASDATLAHRC